MAWLRVTPDGDKKTRKEQLHEGSPYRQLITLTEYEASLVRYWHDCGTVSSNGMGASSLPWSEILAWANSLHSQYVTDWKKDPKGNYHPITTKEIILENYELEFIRQLSSEYAAELSDNSQSKLCPREVDVDEFDAMAESTALGNAMIELFGKSNVY
jgi:hypothetical protein